MYCSLIALRPPHQRPFERRREGGGGTNEYSSCPAVSNTSKRATSSSITHCLRYESSCHRGVARVRPGSSFVVSLEPPLLHPPFSLSPPSPLAISSQPTPCNRPRDPAQPRAAPPCNEALNNEMGTDNGRIILVHKVGLDELNREGRLADSSAAYYDQFVLSQELGLRGGEEWWRSSGW